ncbi:MAG TPA: aryl-sulfate sulfotransferase [Candidatus Binatia bacterium]
MAEGNGGRRRIALAGLALGVLLWGGCGGGGGGGKAPAVAFLAAPTVDAGPNTRAPLVRVVTADTNVPTRLSIRALESAPRTGIVSLDGTVTATHHAEPLLGLRPGHGYDVTVTAIAADGSQTAADPVHVETAPLPADFPDIVVHGFPDVGGMEPGLTLIGTRNKNQQAAFIVILDDTGQVVWFLDIDTSAVAIPLANGHIATILGSRAAIEEVDLLGNTVHTWYAARATTPPPPNGIPVDVFTFHNDVAEDVADGTFLVPTDIVRFVDDFPTSETDPTMRATSPVLDEPIVEFAESDGSVHQTWNFLDVLKPTRIGFDGTTGLPVNADWAHTNAVLLDGGGDAIIASLRHQDAVVKLGRPDGQLRWILGPHANWEGFEQFLLTPVGDPFAWSYHQHAPQRTARGTLLVFDNGDYQASPFTGEIKLPAAMNHSRAVEYEIDEQAMTVRQLWQFVASEQLYSPFVGSAYEMPATGNVLVTYGGLCTIGGVPSDDIATCRGTGRVIEVAHASADRVVYDVEVQDPDPAAIGWLVYRAYRLPRFAGTDG